MAKVTISKAIKLSGVSRSTFYTSYINQGKITVSKDKDGKKCIDTSELLRVFGELQLDTPVKQPNSSTEQLQIPQSNTKYEDNQSLKVEVALLKQQLEGARQREEEFSKREQWYQGQISNLTDSIKLLEAPTPQSWWKFWK